MHNPPWRCCRRSTGGRRSEYRRSHDASTSTKTVTLYYRDGDDDQPLTSVQAANQSAVDHAVAVVLGDGDGASSLPSPSVLTSTEESVTSPTGPHRSKHLARSMMRITTTALPRQQQQQQQQQSTAPPPVVRDEQQQLVMDEYLEFVRRRYNRLQMTTSIQPATSHSKASSSGHRQRSKPSNTTNIFLSRLTLSHRPLPSSLSSTPTSRVIACKEAAAHDNIIVAVEEEDTLQALGLSDLASEKLRQRLHVHVQPTKAAFVNYQIMTTRDTTSPIKASSATTAAASCVISSIGGALQQIMRVLTSLHRIACSFLLQWGGLRHSTRIMSVTSVALVAYVSRHVFKQSGG